MPTSLLADFMLLFAVSSHHFHYILSFFEFIAVTVDYHPRVINLKELA